MQTVTFYPARLRGSALVPPAKSEAHRALLLAALGHGACRLHGLLSSAAKPQAALDGLASLCDDTRAMLNGIQALGATAVPDGNALVVTPAPDAPLHADLVTCHVHACAAALRMLIPAFLVRGQRVRFTMEPALFNRPLDALAPLLAQIGGGMVRTAATKDAPASVELYGTLRAGMYAMDGSQSSQFASGLLIALAHARDASGLPAPSTLTVTKPIVSRPYLAMTQALMERFHVPCEEREEGVFTLCPATELSPESVAVAGDWSQAAVLLCANAMGSGVMVGNLSNHSTQGDSRVVDVLGAMGLRMAQVGEELYAVCPSHAGLIPAEIDCTDIPDLAPILALTCTQAHGRSRLTGVRRLRLKECDRLAATLELLARLGAKAEVSADDDTLTVYGPARLTGGFAADARGDHRVVMLLAIAALLCEKPITVSGADALNKSWPGFLATYRALGGVIA
ncbi:MAG: hypothetical protein RR367_05760 [Clostridia bacterium]